jgi:hypothetical protein
MWGMTGWVIKTWLKLTVCSALVVFGVWLFTDEKGWFYAALLVAGLVQTWAIPALCREWADQARYAWWWTR